MYDGWGFHSGILFFIPAAVMVISMFPVMLLPEGGVRQNGRDDIECDTRCHVESIRLFWIFLIAMTLINFGRNGVMIIQSQYLFLDTGFGVSSRVLSYIFNTESIAIIIFGLLAGRIGKLMGDGRSVCLGAIIAMAYLLIYAFSENLKWIYVASWFRGTADVIILAASYAFASMLIPPERRGTLFSLFNATLFLSWGVAGTLIAGPIVDTLLYYGFHQKIAYRAAYLSGLGMVLMGFIVQILLVFVLLPRTASTQIRRRF